MFKPKGTIFIILVVALTIIAPPVRAQEIVQAAQDRSITAQVDKMFEKWDKPSSPGCALAVIRDGRIVYKRGYGMSNLEYGIPIGPSTVFNIGSMSKPFTAAAVVLLAQQGKLSLDDPVRQYLPELPDFAAPITIRHLLYHTSGLRCDVWGVAGWRNDVHTEDDMLELQSRQKELSFRPGENYAYCNTGYELLAVIVRRVSGQSFREFTRANIFEPLGMKSSFFRDDHAEVVKNVAVWYGPASGGGFRAGFNTWDAVGATGMLTTVEDLALWEQNSYEPRVGGRALIEQLQERALLNNGQRVNSGRSFGVAVRTYRGLPTIEIGGGVMRFPEQRLSVICLCNNGGAGSGFALVRQVADLYLAKELKEPVPSSVQLTEQQLTAKVGFYWNSDTDEFLRISMKDGKLQLIGNTGTTGTSEMQPLSENHFGFGGFYEAWFEPTTGETHPRLVVDWAGILTPQSFKPVDQFRPATAQLADYAGTYVSEEIDAIWRVAPEQDKLVLKRLKFKPNALEPALPDVFIGLPWTLRFTRDSNNRVSGFVLNRHGSFRNLRFTKQVWKLENFLPARKAEKKKK